MDTNAIWECFFCWGNVSSQKPHIQKNAMTKIYASCIRHLNESVMGNDITSLPLEELDNDTHKLNSMCAKCLNSVKMLADINARLEAIEKEVNDFVNDFTKSTLTHRKLKDKSKQDRLVGEIHSGVRNTVLETFDLSDSDEIKSPNEFIHIKSETDQNYEPEDVTDYFSFDEEKQIEPTTDPLSMDNNNSTSTSGLPDSEEIIDSIIDNQESPTETNDDGSSLIDKVLDTPSLDDDVEIISVQCNPEMPVTSTSQIETSAINSIPYNQAPLMQPMQLTENCGQPPSTSFCSKNINRDTRDHFGMFNELGSGNGPANMKCRTNWICKCNICGKILPSEQSMIIHLEVYHKVTVPHQRNDNITNNSENFNLNSFSIRPPVQNYVTCNVCFTAFPSAQLLYSHQKQCLPQRLGNNHYFSGEVLLSCELCPSSFRTISDLRLHVCTVHDIPLHCEVCQMTFNDPNKLEMHKMSHKETVICSLCQAPFPNINHLNTHIERVHLLTPQLYNGIRNPNLSPNNVGRVSNINTVTTGHTNSSMDSSNNKPRFKPFRCLICHANFDNLSDLTSHSVVHSHLKKSHNFYRLFVCEICGVPFPNIQNLNTHLERVHFLTPQLHDDIRNPNLSPNNVGSVSNINTVTTGHNNSSIDSSINIPRFKPFRCLLCNADFDSISDLTAHGSVHPEVKKMNTFYRLFVCEICGVSFKTIVDLTAHTKAHSKISKANNIRDNSSLFRCANCEKCFNTQIELKTHQIEHAAQVKFYCHKCPYTFQSEDELMQHKMQNHPNGDFYSCRCTACGAFFKDIPHLEAHTRFDSQGPNSSVQIQFKCCLCHDTFKSNIELSNHQNVHTGRAVHCRICNLQLTNMLELARHNDTCHQGNGNEKSRELNLMSCPAPFRFEGNFSTHQNSFHQINIQPNRSPNTCNICKMPFTENTNIKCHYRLCSKLRHLRKNLQHFDHDVKRGDKKHKCPVCYKSFNHNPSLKFHLITHSKRKT